MFKLRDWLTGHQPKNNHYFTLAVDGRGAAGKSDLEKHLKNLLPDFLFLRGDDYFEPIKHPILWGGFNDERFNQDVIAHLRLAEQAFDYRPYDWHSKPHVKKRPIKIEQGICIERCFSFAMPISWDLKIWVETPHQICQERGIRRDLDFGNSQAVEAWRDIWQPEEDAYIARIKPLETANLVLDGTRPFALQIG